MAEIRICELLDLPETMPRCVVEINTFDDPKMLRDNVADYVITPTVANELVELVDRVIASVRRNEPGEGHYVHGAFGSGKSHFMGILGLILSSNPVVWKKDHPVIRQIEGKHHSWLAENPILTIPVYMLGKKIPFQYAIYESANQRLESLGQPPCEFSEAIKVIDRFRLDAERYGEVVWEKFREATSYSQARFERMVEGSDNERDAIAQAILEYEGGMAKAERQQLYPDSISQGVEKLTAHARSLGYKGIVYLVDELILYLTGKSGREWLSEFGDVVAAVDDSRTRQVIPLWMLVARQKEIADIMPDSEVSEQEINEEMEHHQDRFPHTTRLPDRELVPIVEERVLRPRSAEARETIQTEVAATINGLSSVARDTLIHDLTLGDFQRLYPFHPALIRTLIDVTARLSRERTAIRLLYELLIERHPNLTLGKLVPYASLFDTVFSPEGVVGDRKHPDLVATWETYFARLLPAIAELTERDQAGQEALQAIVKTILLAQLSRTLRDQITVEHILHLNYTDLKGRTDYGAHTRIHDLLNQLANRTELINFQANPQHPDKAAVSIAVTEGPQLGDALTRVPLNAKMRHDAFNDLLRPLLGASLRDGVLQDYKLNWRGIDRGGRVLFRNVRELLPADMNVPENKQQEFTLFIDYPWEDETGKGPADDQTAIQRGRNARGPLPVGFWLPQMLDEADLKDLNEYAQLLELEANLEYYLSQDFSKRARDGIAAKLPGFRQTKERNLKRRLSEVYLQGQVTFLDTEIQPGILVNELREALDRTAREVFRYLHPHHPRFQRKVTTRTLRRFLDEVLVKAEQEDGVVANAERVDLAKAIGEPLELVEVGTNRIGIRPQSRYLVKASQLAQGRRIDADKIRGELEALFGFTNEVVDLFLLYLIKGKGYRVLKGDRPLDAAAIDFGKLAGVTLERGQQLEVHEWTKIKAEVLVTWGGQFQAQELTIAAQDELWAQVGRMAREAAKSLDEIRDKLDGLIRKAGGAVSDAPRMRSILAATALNKLAQQGELDSYDGLRTLLAWKSGQEGISRADARGVIRDREGLRVRLNDLSPDTVKRIANMAVGGDLEAEKLRARTQNFLIALQREADLATHIHSWSTDANALIDQRLQEATKEREEEPKDVELDQTGKPIKDGEIIITEATLVMRGKKQRVPPMAKQALCDFFQQAGEGDISGRVKVEIRVESD